MKSERTRHVHEIESLTELLARQHSLRDCVVQGVDLQRCGIDWTSTDVDGVVFLGCVFNNSGEEILVRARGAFVFPRFEGLPYDPYRSCPYTWQELMEGYEPGNDRSVDRRIYDHFVAQGRHDPDIREALAQRIHDHAIDDALRDIAGSRAHGAATERKCVGIMGGHGVPRGDPFYRKAAATARLLTRAGYFIVSGGGPGIMEASNLGAYMADRDAADLDAAVEVLAQAPSYRDAGHHGQALAVLGRYPTGSPSLAVPTWFYGHEPSNLFASHIAKHFSNAIREDTLLAVCLHGIVYAPGSAGTTQEIFTDAAQNHYATLGVVSPMVFLGRQRYVEETGIYPLLTRLAAGRKYAAALHCSDDPEDIVAFIQSHPPMPVLHSS